MQILPANAAYAPAGVASSTWETETGSSVLQNDTAWLLSFIDILTLLLTLFVLLLAYDRNEQPVGELSLKAPQERAAEFHEPPVPVTESLETRYPPATPLLLNDSFTLFDSRDLIQADSIEALIGDVEPGESSPAPGAVAPVETAAVSASDAVPAQPVTRVGAESVSISMVGNNAVETPPSSPLPDTDSVAMSLLPASEPELLDRFALELPPGTEVLPVELPAGPAERSQETAAAQDLLQKLSSQLRERVEVSVATGVVNVEISDNILFRPASAALTDAAYAVLDELAVVLRDQPGVLSVEGHTDNVPIKTALFPSNWELSSARAAMVTRSFITRGVAPDRIRAIGYGDTRPRADNLSAEGRARNRRVSFVLHLE